MTSEEPRDCGETRLPLRAQPSPHWSGAEARASLSVSPDGHPGGPRLAPRRVLSPAGHGRAARGGGAEDGGSRSPAWEPGPGGLWLALPPVALRPSWGDRCFRPGLSVSRTGHSAFAGWDSARPCGGPWDQMRLVRREGDRGSGGRPLQRAVPGLGRASGR